MALKLFGVPGREERSAQKEMVASTIDYPSTVRVESARTQNMSEKSKKK